MARSSRRRGDDRRAPGGDTTAPLVARPPARRGVLVAIALGLVGLTLAIYAPVRTHQFVGVDDPEYVSANVHVRSGLSPGSVAWAFRSTEAANWHPVTWLSHLLDVELFGLNAGAHHMTSVVLHAANTALLFALLAAMTGAPGRSAVVAALFGAHPLHVESVAWIAERKDVLSTLFFLLTIGAYVRYVRRPGPGRYLVVLVLYALGLMAKPMLVTLPVVLLLLDVWPLARDVGSRASVVRLVREKLPLIALAIASSVVTIVVQERGGAVGSLEAYSLSTRLANAVVTCVAYLERMVWPVRLAAFYPYQTPVPVWSIIVSAAVLVGVSFLALRAARRRPELFVGWAWYLATLVPVIGVIQVGRQASADRYTYIPLIGVFIAIVWGVHAFGAGRRVFDRAAAIGAIAVVLMLGVSARAQVATWKDDVTLWSSAVASTRHLDNHSSRYALGTALRQRGDTDGAVVEFREAMRLRPDFVAAHYELGLAILDRGQPVEALPHFETVIRLQPGHINARRAAAETFMRRGEPGKSLEYLQEALRLEPANADVHHQIGLALARLGRMDDAAGAFAETVRLRPSDEAARVNLALALAAAGRRLDAMRELREVLRTNPGHLAARQALAGLERVK